MLIIPSIDLLDGRCVRLINGDFTREIAYDADPVETARVFEQEGAQWIHVIDLNGARTGEMANLAQIREIVGSVGCQVQVGGGVRTRGIAERLLEIGVGRVVLGTALVRDLDLSREMFAAFGERVVAGIDARAGKAAVAGWTEPSDNDAVQMALRMQDAGVRRLIVTDIARDGAMEGPNTAFLQSFLASLSIPMIASGGVSDLSDLMRLRSLTPMPEAVIVGRAIYEGRIRVAAAVEILGS
jgi:phosphoribosylformimino-5-aminoimidazole carboxamide ribotide isomerase